MQVGEQILDILLTQFLAISGHFISSEPDDVADPLVVRGQPTQRQVLALEHTLQSRTFLAAGGIRLMTAVALCVIDLPARRLLGIKPEFGIGFAALDITGTSHENRCQYENQQRELRPIERLSMHELPFSNRIPATPHPARLYNDSAIL